LVDCARSGDELVKVAEIAQRLEITQQNTFKIVHLLSRGGFVKAVRGRYGGVKLARPAEEIRVGEVVGVMEGSALEAREEERQSAQAIFDDALDAFISVLNQHTIADMASTPEPAPSESHRPATTRSGGPRSASLRASRGAIRC
jgi:Rrf2 family nitric oxide-sensitive transcriptional repressor